MNLKETTAVIAILKAAYPKWKPESDTAGVWAGALADLSSSEVVAAVRRHMATEQWPPSIAELRAACVQQQSAMHIDDEDTAWGKVLDEVWRVGSYGTPEFDNPAIRDAVNAVGWDAICASEMIGVERAHFAKAYSATRKRILRAAALPDGLRDEHERLRAAEVTEIASRLLKGKTID